MPKILVTLPKLYRYDNDLEKAAPGCEFVFIPDEDRDKLTHDDLLGFDIIIGNTPTSILHDLPQLKWMQLYTAGSDNYARQPIFSGEKAPVLTNATGAFGITLAEHMLAQLLVLSRDFLIYRDHMHRSEGRWDYFKAPETLDSKKALILGLGDIGTNLAKRLDCCGCEVYGIRRTNRPSPYVREVHPLSDIDQLLPDMDFVCLCLPNSDETVHVINEHTLSLMKPSAFVINVGRGPSVDNIALAAALQNGVIAGAALDVTEPEPLPDDHPLWNCENCLITPHSAGWYRQRSPYERILQIACDNLQRFLAGKPVTHQVDITTGYMKHE